MEKKTEPNAPLPWQPQVGWGGAPPPTPTENRSLAMASGAELPPAARRSIPMEGAVLYRKSIDNSSVKYRHDPTDRHALRAQLSWGLFFVVVLLLATSPRLLVRHSGYRQAQLSAKIEKLVAVREHLKVEKGRVEDLQRVERLAAELGFSSTGDESYTWTGERRLGGGSEPTVAQLISDAD